MAETKCPRCGKVAHRSEAAAIHHMHALAKVGKATFADMNVYRCGDVWHVGHSIVKFKQRIRFALKPGRDSNTVYKRRAR